MRRTAGTISVDQFSELKALGHPLLGTKSAAEYGYLGGEIQGSSGHVRVGVNADSARVDYVRAYLPAAEGGSRRNGDVSYSYVVDGKEITQRREGAKESR